MSDELDLLLRSWARSLRARNLAPKTIKTYTDCAAQLIDHLRQHRKVERAADNRRAHVEDFLAALAERRSAATVSVRYRGP